MACILENLALQSKRPEQKRALRSPISNSRKEKIELTPEKIGAKELEKSAYLAEKRLTTLSSAFFGLFKRAMIG